MELPKIRKNQIKSEIYALRLNPNQKELIKKSAKMNEVPYSVVIRSAINSYFKIDD